MNDPHSEPFIFFGTPYVARDTLETLHRHEWIPALVVTSPDAPRGRGLSLTPSETKEWALAHDLPVITPEKITDDVLETIRSYHAEYAVVVAYGKILPQKLIDIFPLGVINVHYSLLPKYRGASPVEAALLNGDMTTGVSIQKMVRELDAGDVLASKEVAIEPTETTRELRPRLITIGSEMLVDMLPSFITGTITPEPQDASQATHSQKITKENGLLDLNGNDEKNWNTYRAYAESPGTYFFVTKNDKPMRVKIKTATFTNGRFTPDRIIPEGKSEQSYADFSRNL